MRKNLFALQLTPRKQPCQAKNFQQKTSAKTRHVKSINYSTCIVRLTARTSHQVIPTRIPRMRTAACRYYRHLLILLVVAFGHIFDGALRFRDIEEMLAM